jgi:hypothetical protein
MLLIFRNNKFVPLAETNLFCSIICSRESESLKILEKHSFQNPFLLSYFVWFLSGD